VLVGEDEVEVTEIDMSRVMEDRIKTSVKVKTSDDLSIEQGSMYSTITNLANLSTEDWLRG
jgi:hypothetical protein